MQDMKNDESASRNTLTMKTMDEQDSSEDTNDKKIDIIHLDDILDDTSRRQDKNGKCPLYKCDLSYITTEKLENYLLLKMALDQNLDEHKRLLQTLSSILSTVQGLNDG